MRIFGEISHHPSSGLCIWMVRGRKGGEHVSVPHWAEGFNIWSLSQAVSALKRQFQDPIRPPVASPSSCLPTYYLSGFLCKRFSLRIGEAFDILAIDHYVVSYRAFTHHLYFGSTPCLVKGGDKTALARCQ